MSTAGSITRASNGTWSFVVDLLDERQTSSTPSAWVPDQEGGQAVLTAYLADKNLGAVVAPSRATLGGNYLLDVWLPARRSSLRPSTAAAYEERDPELCPSRSRPYASPDGRWRARPALHRLLTEGPLQVAAWPQFRPLAKTVRNVRGVLARAMRTPCDGASCSSTCDTADPPRRRS